jgi:adenylate kinase family enzyme
MEQAVAQGKTLFLIDGFPRNQENLEGLNFYFLSRSSHIYNLLFIRVLFFCYKYESGWQNVMGDYCTLAFTYFFNCSESVMESRLLERGKTSGRSDDNAESIRKRYECFEEL